MKIGHTTQSFATNIIMINYIHAYILVHQNELLLGTCIYMKIGKSTIFCDKHNNNDNILHTLIHILKQGLSRNQLQPRKQDQFCISCTTDCSKQFIYYILISDNFQNQEIRVRFFSVILFHIL